MGLEAIKRRFGKVCARCSFVSKHYAREESWRGPAWWFDLPLDRLELGECKCVFMACHSEDEQEWIILIVPVSYVLDKQSGLLVIDGKVRLHLSSCLEGWLVDQRGPGRVEFGQFEQYAK